MSGRIFLGFWSIFYLLQHCHAQECKLENGVAFNIGQDEGEKVYFFTCYQGYQLRGSQTGKCNSAGPLKTRCVPSSCWQEVCSRITSYTPRYYMERCRRCPRPMITKWRCQPYVAYSCTCPKMSVFNSGYINVTYSRQEDQGFPVGTIVSYSCYSPHGRKGNYMTAKCTKQGWSSERVPSCVCGPISHIPPGMYMYNQRQLSNGYYAIGTLAHYNCPDGYALLSPSYSRECTAYGWNDSRDTPTCVLKPSTETPVVTSTTIHNHHNNEMVIVSATIATTMAVLIILVTIVTCQRRLHYHRIRRARLRCHQDRDAFSAYITYHHNVGMMLPSYDEACQQHQHGEPPTFDEAVATSARQPSDPLPSPPQPPSEGDDSVVIRPSTSTEEFSHQSRLLHGLRMFFGRVGFTRSETTYGVYAQITSNTSNESLNTQESNVVDNQEQHNPATSNDRELNTVLSQAGLC